MYTKTKDEIFANIVAPLANAMKKVNVNADSVMKVYADILFDEDVSPATRIHSIEVFFKLLGLSAPERIETTQVHKIKVNKKTVKKNKKG